MTAPTNVAQTLSSSASVPTELPRARMKMAVPGIWSEPLAPSRSSWPAASDTKTRAMTARAERPMVRRIPTARNTLRPMSTVRLAPSRTEVRTVSCTAYTDDAAPKAGAKPPKGRQIAHVAPAAAAVTVMTRSVQTRLVSTQEESLQPDEENGRRSPRDVSLATLSRRGRASLCRVSHQSDCPATRRAQDLPLPGGRLPRPGRPALLRLMESSPPHEHGTSAGALPAEAEDLIARRRRAG